jgi:hypothetical protein
MDVSVWKRLKSFVRGVREYKRHFTTRYKEAPRKAAYEAGRAFARKLTRYYY